MNFSTVIPNIITFTSSNHTLNNTIIPTSNTTSSLIHTPTIISTTFQTLNVTFPNHTFSSVHPSGRTPAQGVHPTLPPSFIIVSFLLILTYISLVTYSVVNFCRQAGRGASSASSSRRASASYMPFRNETPFLYGAGNFGDDEVVEERRSIRLAGPSLPFLYRSADGSLSSH